MFQCLMLDVDGVVVTGRPEDGRSWATDIERDLGVAPDRLQTVFFAPHWTDIVTGRKALPEILETCLPDLAPGLTARAFMDYWFERDSRLDDAVLADCDALRSRGVRILLATNQEHERAHYLMDILALRSRVDGIVYSAQVGEKKPSAAFFDAAARLSGAQPEDILLVDDTQANIDAAQAIGWAVRHWTGRVSLLDLVDGI